MKRNKGMWLMDVKGYNPALIEDLFTVENNISLPKYSIPGANMSRAA
ncbi:MAG: hypothetical protein Q8M95_15735 [Candidatus Methanoperedens sp.]|nr:hypothetical protein [Candidatus Methanoperedens sp.]